LAGRLLLDALAMALQNAKAMETDLLSTRAIEKVSRGRQFEDLATEHCKAKGYQILHRNYRQGRLEADIVAKVGQLLIVVEVRGRTASTFRASKTIHPNKLRRLGVLAQTLARRYRAPKIRLELLEIVPVRRPLPSEPLATDLAAHVFQNFRLH
jgi:putative endonuclease